jgi:hypothetical protein
MNFKEKYYQCINFSGRCKFELNRGTAFGNLLFTEDSFIQRRTSFHRQLIPSPDSLTVLGLNKNLPRNVQFSKIRQENDDSFKNEYQAKM